MNPSHPLAQDATNALRFGSVMGNIRRFGARAGVMLAAIAVAYALYGLVVQLGGFEMVAWEEKRHYQDSVTSTFINRNSYGTFAGIGLLVICGLLVRAMRRIAGEGVSSAGYHHGLGIEAGDQRQDGLVEQQAELAVVQAAWHWQVERAAGPAASRQPGVRPAAGFVQ